MSAITPRLNGQTHSLDLDPATPLLCAGTGDLAMRGLGFGGGTDQIPFSPERVKAALQARS